MLTAGLLEHLARLAPPGLAEDWDNVGLIVGRRDRPVRRVLVALDLRDAVLREAREAGAGAIVVHHPPIFTPLATVTDGAIGQELVLRAAEDGVSVIAAHTNLDAAAGGLNDRLADLLGMTGRTPLVPNPADPACGLGRVGTVPAVTLGALAARAVAAIPGAVTCTGDAATPVRRVACCTGSGASLIDDARAAGVDAYVTGDLKYHDADRAEGMPLLCLPHGQTERVAMHAWFPLLREALAGEGVDAVFAATDTDPWRPVPR